jgi:hypothetical protein
MGNSNFLCFLTFLSKEHIFIIKIYVIYVYVYIYVFTQVFILEINNEDAYRQIREEVLRKNMLNNQQIP